jgi:NAD(P)-dependent dehydrogenase (short-subunit alcohol dehydrogenase family)
VEAGEAVAAAINSQGGVAVFAECDVSSESSINAAVEAVAQGLGGLNILVNVAGVNIMATVTDTEIERWDRAQHVNLRSVFLASKAALPHLMAGGPSSIVNTSSVQATRGVPNFPSYAASKAGMQGLSRQMAVDYAQHAVRINCVSPGAPCMKRLFCAILHFTPPPPPEDLPRQARDKRRESWQKTVLHSAGGIETGLNANSQLLEQVLRKRISIWRHLILKTIILPRQARDEHIGSTQIKSGVFLQEFLPKTAAPVRNQMNRESADADAIQLEYDPTPRLFVSGLPVDVAYTILFLASEESVHITGQNLMVDGGSSIAANAGNVPGISG